MNVTVYGETYSVYVRFVRLALTEKGVDYNLVPVDIFAPSGPPPEHLKRHPFGKIPAFAHGDFTLFETLAITRYIDDAFDGPSLIPGDLLARARMNQITAIVDSYVYRSMVWGVYTGAVSDPEEGLPRNEEAIAEGLKKAAICLDTLQELRGESQWLVGERLTLADLSLAPMLAYFLAVPEALELWKAYPRLHPWWATLRERPSMTLTRIAAMAA
jgi:glutathione S-transferase